MSTDDGSKTPEDAAREDAMAQRYRFLAEMSPVQLWTSLPSGMLDYVTDQTAARLGLTPARLLADGWQNVVHPDDLARAVERWTSSLSTGEIYEVEFRLKLASGEYAWHLVRAVPQRDDAGAIVRWFGTNTNIEAERAHQQRVQALLEEVEQQASRLREQNQLLALESEVARALTHTGTLEEALRACAESVVRHLDAAFARIWTTNDDGMLELSASAGASPPGVDSPGRVPVESLSDPLMGDRAWAIREGMVGFADHSLHVGDTRDKLVGVIAAFSRRPLPQASLSALETVAFSLAQVIERRRTEERLRISETWFSTTLESIGDGVIATDREGRVTFMNSVAEQLTGWARTDAFAKPLSDVFDIVGEDDRRARESPVTMVLREGTVVGLANHTSLLRRDGSEVPIADSAAPIRDSSGALTGVILVFRDAGEQRRVDAERTALLEQERRARRDAETARAELRSLFMQAPAPIAVLRGKELVYELANPAYMELIGRERDILGRSVVETRPDLKGTGFLEQFETVFRTGKRFLGQREVAFKREDGTLAQGTYDFVVAPFHGLDDAVAGILVIAFDVSDAVRAREAIQSTLKDRERMLDAAERARQTAELASRAKDDFLATASHELRTPLNAILGWAQLLRDGAVPPSNVARGLETIERNAKIQTQLIEDILDGSRIITGKLHLEIRAVDLVAVISAAIDTVRPAATAKSIELELELDPAAAHIRGDADRLQQVVWNVVSNAIKFTPKGGKVEVRALRAGSHIELSVKDNGKGITADFVPHVFERFRQADESTTRRHGGLGLGLALVRHLVEAHGGTVTAESEGEGKGALFTLTLPVLAVLAEEPLSNHPRATPTTPLQSLAANALIGIRVLVIDDEPDARELVAAVLRTRGAEVIVATSVDEAVELLQARAPHVLVSDVGMPVTDGYSLVARIRALPTIAARTPAIALTAYAREQDRSRALRAGFQAHIAKPVDPEALVRLIGEVMLRGA